MGQEHLRVAKHCEGPLFRGWWKCVRPPVSVLGEGPKAGLWDGHSWMGKEAEGSVSPLLSVPMYLRELHAVPL